MFTLIRCGYARLVGFLLVLITITWTIWSLKWRTEATPVKMGDETLQYFLRKGKIENEDAADVGWYHAANSRSRIAEGLQSSSLMIEADIILRGYEPTEPIMAHPPATDSDITLHDWLKEVLMSDKGIKLDFKSLQAVAPSMRLLEEVRGHLLGPVWINADILSGPGGKATPLDPVSFLQAVSQGLPGDVLSLGWTTGWSPNINNPGYSWEMVQEMEKVCRRLKQPVTFPVRAALLAQSFNQLQWLLQQSSRYSLTVWTGQTDEWSVEDLLPYRQSIDQKRVYYDIPEQQLALLKKLTSSTQKDISS
ncbi:protein FAM151B-like isoform X1 [Brienomyrus brachyistius]|uniref:protein FAM151B-like isoform X1 n=2 Tax=Brienomyrus brachyistius TaxID=42636 RepID=UPI0020B2C048|nr:protein FAM151B-like isoform X1 [Brienomyrus brachyistius]XP_048847625.1 protein FAM151B-like isoform X1 [Brienomyrus brachyistius]XP_048861568.1 protein FAM151B-like isoform X1 [Brienomyrus brachyistius]XP_048861569.1 protein FAM151B-like isoform X1 [Brienomyrus brachyistius]